MRAVGSVCVLVQRTIVAWPLRCSTAGRAVTGLTPTCGDPISEMRNTELVVCTLLGEPQGGLNYAGALHSHSLCFIWRVGSSAFGGVGSPSLASKFVHVCVGVQREFQV